MVHAELVGGGAAAVEFMLAGAVLEVVAADTGSMSMYISAFNPPGLREPVGLGYMPVHLFEK